MKVKNSISTTMRTLKGKETKDKAAKNIFSYKPIMGNILKYTVAEYRDCSLEEIMNCIEGDTIRTGTAFVEEDMAGSIRGEQAEFNTTDEAPAVFDILFRSLLPKKKGNILVNLHVDFELQKNYRPGYPVIKRGIYYGCRKLSAQLDKVGKMGKAINIWKRSTVSGSALRIFPKNSRIPYLITRYIITKMKVSAYLTFRSMLRKQTLWRLS